MVNDERKIIKDFMDLLIEYIVKIKLIFLTNHFILQTLTVNCMRPAR